MGSRSMENGGFRRSCFSDFSMTWDVAGLGGSAVFGFRF